MKSSLDTFAVNVCIVVKLGTIPKEQHADYCKRLNSFCTDTSRSIENYALILHNQDTIQVKENNVIKEVPKVPHIHLVFRYSRGMRKRLQTTLNDLCSYLHCDTDMVEIDKVNNDIASLQYLIHKNDLDKHQYDISEVIHNYDIDMFNNLMTMTSTCVSIESLFDVVKLSKGNLYQVMKKVGLADYRAYRNVINDLIFCYDKKLDKED